MFSLWKVARFSATAAIFLCVAHEALGQMPGYRMPGRPQQGQQQQQTKKMPFKAEGTVAAVAPGALRIVIDGNAWTVHPERDCKIQVTGSADVGALRSGQFVRFQGEFDNKGTLTTPLAQLEVVTPNSPGAIGIFPQGAAQTAGSGKGAKRAKSSAPETGTYLIVGKLTSIKDRELVVAAGPKPVQVQLAENATVHVDVADYSLAQPGDKAAVQGWFMQPGKAFANAIAIVLSNPVGGQKNAAATLSQPPAKE